MKNYTYIRRGKQRKFQHVWIAEAALGRPLKGSEEVHHLNEDTKDDRPENLVVCPDRAYHALLHVRQRALEACGNADYKKCVICKTWDTPTNMFKHGQKGRETPNYIHPECNRQRYYIRRYGATKL